LPFAFFSDNIRIIQSITIQEFSRFFIAVLMAPLDDCFCENSKAALGRNVKLYIATLV